MAWDFISWAVVRCGQVLDRVIVGSLNGVIDIIQFDIEGSI
jgi:hypothetical protein